MKLKNSIAIVTGVSHEKGIGAAICRELAEEGAALFFTHWKSEENWAARFHEELTGINGVECSSLEINLSDPNAPQEIIEEVTDKLGIPTILVNNAAHSTRDGYMKLDAKTLDDHYAVNMRATLLLSVAFARQFKQHKKTSGRIINLTSGQDLGPMPGELAYGATKGAISAFTLSLSAELAPLGITVNAINPGPTDTGWITDEIKEELTPKYLSGRMGLPEDAARLALFLASEESEWITGQVINSEGGFLRG